MLHSVLAAEKRDGVHPGGEMPFGERQLSQFLQQGDWCLYFAVGPTNNAAEPDGTKE